MYGKEVHNQNCAILRLILWKEYGCGCMKDWTGEGNGVDEDELNDLRTAMARSLEEKEAEVSAFVPLWQRTVDELLDYFEKSVVRCVPRTCYGKTRGD